MLQQNTTDLVVKTTPPDDFIVLEVRRLKWVSGAVLLCTTPTSEPTITSPALTLTLSSLSYKDPCDYTVVSTWMV